MTVDSAFWAAAALGLAVNLALATGVWMISLPLRDVSIVDAAWSVLIVAPALVMTALMPTLMATGPNAPRTRTAAVLLVASAWALRLSAHILWRHRGQPEDHRYQAIRRRNEPHFQWKSLYLVFGLQALLAWVVALPLMATLASTRPWQLLDTAALLLALLGLAYESVADAQLTRFKADPAQRGRVMDRGLWRYSRHPNYFGECLLWWGLWGVAASAGAWWSVVSPLLMTVLLLKVSGVTLLEADIGQRRPAYADYMRRTNAFIPGSPRS